MSITIGSDPEFGLVDQGGQQVYAYDYLPDSETAAIGVDGHPHIGELRPKYGETPREHLHNLANLIQEADEHIPSHIKITAGSMAAGDDAIGGHLHFGRLGGSRFDLPLALRALDYYVSLPVALLEVQKSAVYRRTRSGYGKLGRAEGGYRRQNWGFEYRTLPSWLLGWGVALSILSIGYAVVDAVKRKSCPSIPGHVPDPAEFYNCDKNALRPLLKQIKTGWRELPLYDEFRLEIAFLNHLLVQKLEWREGQDIRQYWPARGKKKPKHQGQVLGNPKDQNCPQIAELVHGIKGAKVFIYGLNPAREPDIAISDLDMVAGLNMDYQVQGTMFGVAREYDGWLCIGLSLDLRQNIHAAAHLINRILKTEPDIEQRRIPGTNLYRGRTGQFRNRYQMIREENYNGEPPF